jgi:hypothetical protein
MDQLKDKQKLQILWIDEVGKSIIFHLVSLLNESLALMDREAYSLLMKQVISVRINKLDNLNCGGKSLFGSVD